MGRGVKHSGSTRARVGLVVAALALAATACGSTKDDTGSPSTQAAVASTTSAAPTSEATTTSEAPTTTTTAAPTTAATTTTIATTAPPATEPPPPSNGMPNVVCMNLQDAQDLIQSETGVFYSRSVDATGQGRSQILDSNWIVVGQTPAPGTPIGEGDAVLAAVKIGEPSDC